MEHTISSTYTGDLHCESIHNESGTILYTDAPTDHDGKGESFAPTDLVATSLSSCILTKMAIHAERMGWDMVGATCHCDKIMNEEPRTIKLLRVYVCMPHHLTNEQLDVLMERAMNCPVKLSIECEVGIEFHWSCDI